MIDYSTYQSPFSWRYGSDQMRQIFSEEKKYQIWRKVWVALARAQNKKGLVSAEELKDLEDNQDNIDIEKILEIEKSTRHDIVAAIKEFAEKAKVGGGKIHLGATSMDINDNADTVRLTEALNLIEEKLITLLKTFSEKIEKYAQFSVMGYTHLQPAEPTTLGYRFSFYAQDLLTDLRFLRFVKSELKGKGIKGAVGTSASYSKLMDLEQVSELEKDVMGQLGITAVDISSQTAPRKIEVLVTSVLSSIAQSLNKFAFDIRLMQSPGFGEWQEPFSSTQVGSSAMPFKKNPIKSEQICSLSRVVFNLSNVTRDNASNMLLERTLDDSANRRVVLPEIFLSVDEMLGSANKILEGLIIHEKRVEKNLENYWPFSATEVIIVEAVKRGADRQVMHEVLREISMEAWNQVQEGKENPMFELIYANEEIKKYLDSDKLNTSLDVKNHLGNAVEKSKEFAKKILREIT